MDYQGSDHAQPGQAASEQYVYDGDGLRQTKTSNDQLTNEVWDTTGSLPLMIVDGSTAYVTGPGGLPIEQITQGGTVRYYTHDQLGTTTALTDQNGGTVSTYHYDAYGEPTGPAPSIDQPFGYAGQYTDGVTGLQYWRARSYQPETGSFLTRDPLEGTTRQPYSYAGDEPTDRVDPFGLCNANPLTSSFWTEGNCLSDHPVTTIETVGTGVACGVPAVDLISCPVVILGSADFNVIKNDVAEYSQPVCHSRKYITNDLFEATGVSFGLVSASTVKFIAADLEEQAAKGVDTAAANRALQFLNSLMTGSGGAVLVGYGNGASGACGCGS